MILVNIVIDGEGFIVDSYVLFVIVVGVFEGNFIKVYIRNLKNFIVIVIFGGI